MENKAESRRFSAHKIVLAATIPFFNGMFLSNMSESNKSEISILGVDACALEAFIGFAYTGSIQITPYNVQSLLIGASFLQVNSIRNICSKYIEERLSPSTVLMVRNFAHSFMCHNLAATCENYMFDHFDAVSQTDAFLTISGSELLSLLDSDELSVASEERLFHLIINWVEFDQKLRQNQCDGTASDYGTPFADLDQAADAPDLPSTEDAMCSVKQYPWLFRRPSLSFSEPCLQGAFYPSMAREQPEARIDLLPELLKRIRLPLIPANFISSVISKHRLIRENIRCRDLLDEVRDMLLLRDRTATSFCCRPRRGQEVFGIIYAVGGLTSNGDCHGIVETYHPSLGRWELAEHMPSQRSRIGVAALNGCLFAIGGFDGTARLNTTEMFDPRAKVWRTMAPMNYKRSALGAATLDGRIYVCGGYDGVASLRTCEMYSPQQDKWFIIPSMIEPRSAGGLIALSNGCLYAVGGHNGLAIYSSVECYNRRASGPLTAAHLTRGDHGESISAASQHAVRGSPWQPIARMLYRRCRHGVTALRNRIIVAGGYNGANFLRSVEILDPTAGPDVNGLMGQWTEIASLHIPRSRVGLAVTGGRLYAIGGYDGTSHLRTVECFQPPSSYSDDNNNPSTMILLSEVMQAATIAGGSSGGQFLPEASNHPLPLEPESPVVSQVSSTLSSAQSDSSSFSSDGEDDSDGSGPSRLVDNSANSQSPDSASHVPMKAQHPTLPSQPVAFSNWTWIPAAPLIAHEGWVGVGVLPLLDGKDNNNDAVPSPSIIDPMEPILQRRVDSITRSTVPINRPPPYTAFTNPGECLPYGRGHS